MTSPPQSVAVISPPATMSVVQQPQLVGQPAWSPAFDHLHTRKRTLYGLGITEVVFGALIIILGIVAIAIGGGATRYYYDSYYGYVYYSLSFTQSAQGIWGGLFVLITGVLGIRVKSNPTRQNYIANMALAIITAILSLVALILSAVAAVQAVYFVILIAVHALIALLSFVSFILTITHAAFCCGGACKSLDSITVPQVAHIPQQNMILTQQPQYVPGPPNQFAIANQVFPMKGTVNIAQPGMTEISGDAVLQREVGPGKNTQSPPSYA